MCDPSRGFGDEFIERPGEWTLVPPWPPLDGVLGPAVPPRKAVVLIIASAIAVFFDRRYIASVSD